jgi:hypothetical protein
MKFIRVLVFILLTLSLTFASQAQDLKSEWSYAVTRSLQYQKPDQAVQAIARANAATEKLFQAQQVSFQKIKLENSNSESFLILADSKSKHALNREATKLVRLYPEIKVVYSPAHLMRGADGFFSERDQALGISNTMVDREGGLDPTFYHEMVHARHFFHRMKGGTDALNAVFTVTEPDVRAQLSETGSGYRRNQTLEEIEAHVVSLVYLAHEVAALKAANAKLDSIEQVLNLMYYTAQDGDQLSRQSSQLIRKTLSSSSWTDGSAGSIQKFGRRSVWVREFVISASPSFQGGAKASFKLSKPVSDSKLKALLTQADQIAVQIAPEYKAVCDSMYWMIERVDAKRTNLEEVMRSVQKLKTTFETLRQN